MIMETNDLESTLPQPPDHSPAAIAGELMVDALLRYHAVTNAVARERRVVRVLEAVGHHAAPPAHADRFVRIPRWFITAAAIILASAGLLLLYPSEQSAQADFTQSVARLRKPGDRRFEVAVNGWDEPDDTTFDTVDMRFPEGLLLVRHQPPWEPEPLVVGKDAQGYWSFRRDGTVSRTNAQRHLPPYITIDGASMFEDPLDKLLERLPATYNLERLPDAALKPGEKELERIRATRLKTHRSRADTVLLWIDPIEHELERIEFGWTSPELRKVEEGNGLGDRPPPPGDDHLKGPPPDDRPPPGDRPPRDRPPPPGHDRRPPPGHHRGPPPPPKGTPRSIIFQRVPIDRLPPDWFTAEGQLSSKQR